MVTYDSVLISSGHVMLCRTHSQRNQKTARAMITGYILQQKYNLSLLNLRELFPDLCSFLSDFYHNVNNLQHLLALLLGSRGPSTVTLIAFGYIATWGGCVPIVMVKLKLLPERDDNKTHGEMEQNCPMVIIKTWTQQAGGGGVVLCGIPQSA